MQFFDAIDPVKAWYEEPENLIQVGMAVAATGAAIVAAWNAWEARKTSKISQQQLNIANRPYLAFGAIQWDTSKDQAWHIHFPLINTGQVPAKYIL
jgi:hypothetical protein